MGLFATHDGHVQGWLAALLCCCAAVNDDELGHDHKTKDTDTIDTKSTVCSKQPVPLTALPSYPTATVSPSPNGREPVELEGDSHHSVQPPAWTPSVKPIQPGDSPLLDRRSNHASRKGSTGQIKRLSIGAPHAFRRLDHTDGQRQGLIPLRLGPVVLKENSNAENSNTTRHLSGQGLNVTRGRSDSTQGLLPNSHQHVQQAENDAPAQSTPHWRETATLPPQSYADASSGVKNASSMTHDHPPRPSISTQISSSSIRRQDSSSGLSPVDSKHSSERVRLKRKRSTQSNRKQSADFAAATIDEEILELNTIVEERRAEAARGNRSLHHVPAVAPSMQVGARSETLNAIGSAFSRPLTARDRTPAASTNTDLPLQRPPSQRANRSSSRVSGWLSGIFPSASTSHLPSNEPFYKCQPNGSSARPRSETSLCSFVTELDSPSLTAGSSPTTKGHSRTITAESRMTPLTPSETLYAAHADVEGKKHTERRWQAPGQVGLAL